MTGEGQIEYAKHVSHNYENFIAYCPYCDYRNIFNRREDLSDCNPVASQEVSCFNQECQRIFLIGGDLGDSAYGYLLYDCHGLLQEKRYMYCILNITQAYEVFFSTYLRVELLYRPYAKNHFSEPDSLEILNRLSQKLYQSVSDYTFANLRRIFIRRILYGTPLDSLHESEEEIKHLRTYKKTVSNSNIQRHTKEPLTILLQELNRCRIAELRNKVIHQHAYRPSSEDVKVFFDEACHLILSLEEKLDINDDLNWYCK